MVDIKINIDKLIKKFLPKLLKAIEIDYSIGSVVSIVNAKKQGVKTNMNPLSLTKKQQQTNVDIIETLIKDVNSNIAKQINYVVNKGITENWDTKMVSNALKELPIQETYKNRFKTIATTESFRIMNTSSYNTAKRLGAKEKWIYNVIDRKTGDDSMISHAKYGSEDKSIPIDEPFEYDYKGKTRTFMLPPDRSNDRGQVVFKFE